MKHPSEDLLARYARGDEEATLRPLIEAHLARCPTCEQAVGRLRGAGPGLDETAESAAAALFSGILARIDRAAEGPGASRSNGLPAGVFPEAVLDTLPAPSRWKWWPLWPARGRAAELLRDPSGAQLALLHYRPGTRTPRHAHLADEQCVVLAGGYRSGGRTLGPGDWDHMAPGSEHAPTILPDEDCWCLVRVGPEGVRYTGLSAWRRILVAIVTARRRRAEAPPLGS